MVGCMSSWGQLNIWHLHDVLLHLQVPALHLLHTERQQPTAAASSALLHVLTEQQPAHRPQTCSYPRLLLAAAPPTAAPWTSSSQRKAAQQSRPTWERSTLCTVHSPPWPLPQMQPQPASAQQHALDPALSPHRAIQVPACHCPLSAAAAALAPRAVCSSQPAGLPAGPPLQPLPGPASARCIHPCSPPLPCQAHACPST
jgi:hypothetical protein